MSHPDDDDEFQTEGDTTVFAVRARPRGTASQRHLLVCTEGAEIGRVVTLGKEPIQVGRHSAGELVLEVTGVSRRHAIIRPFGKFYVLEDLESANGTFVNGERVEQAVLQNGAVVAFGPSAAFRYSITDAEQERMLRALFDATQTDSLTGVGNRHAFDTQLSNEVTYAGRHGNSLGLLVIDADHFKSVNDNHGHAVGDEVLRELAARIRGAIRGEDTLSRFGGEEFAVVMRNSTVGQLEAVAERIRLAVLAEPLSSRRLTVTVSIGGALLSETGERTLLECADERLYAAKSGGRNRVVCR